MIVTDKHIRFYGTSPNGKNSFCVDDGHYDRFIAMIKRWCLTTNSNTCISGKRGNGWNYHVVEVSREVEYTTLRISRKLKIEKLMSL